MRLGGRDKTGSDGQESKTDLIWVIARSCRSKEESRKSQLQSAKHD
jgi:hypothetical protein